MLLYSKGLSTRDIQDILKDIYGIELSPSTISRLAVYTVVGINPEGYKDILGFWILETESASQWVSVLNDLKSRGVKVRYRDRKEVAKDLRAIYTQPTEQMAMQKLEEFRSRWESKYPQVVREWEEDWEVITTFYRYPYEVRRCMSNTDLIESVYSKVKKVTDSKRVFPSEDALMKVLYGVALELEEKWKRPVRDWELIRSQLESSSRVGFDLHKIHNFAFHIIPANLSLSTSACRTSQIASC